MAEQVSKLRDWMFRSILFEADSEHFRKAGIKIGADQSSYERSLMNETLNDYPLATRSKALRMSRLYASIYCFENSVRELIRERLESSFQDEWWSKGVSKKIRDKAEDRRDKALENTWLEGENLSVIEFADFGNLTDIIIGKWELFSDLIPSQHWIKQRFDELEKARNFIAHNRFLMEAEFQRIDLYTQDWKKQVGV